MTLEEIKALAAAKIAGQGDQVDLGGALKSIIDGLADAISGAASAAAPFILRGQNSDAFYAAAADVTEAIAAYKAGRRVFLFCEDEPDTQDFYGEVICLDSGSLYYWCGGGEAAQQVIAS